MKYWLTIHWPPLRNSPPWQDGVWLAEGKEGAAKALSPGDLVFVYETLTGRPRRDRLRYRLGRQGLVALFEVMDVNLDPGFDQWREVYRDGTQLVWKLVGTTRTIDDSHYCPHQDACSCLGYSHKYSFQGFGKDKSGLKELSEQQFAGLRNLFQ